MKEENKEFYTEDVDTDVVDLQLEAFDELVEEIMLEALKHMTAKEKLDAKKYRMSASGKKALAKHLKKISRSGYKVDKKRSKLMKKVAKFARRSEELEEEFDFDIELPEICEELYNLLDEEELADFDALIEEIVNFAEACKDDEDCDDIDPESGEKNDDVDEAFRHMTAAAKNKARKYRMSAAGKKALKKYLKKSSRAGYKVDKKRSKLMKKVGAFARHESLEEDALEFGITVEELIKIDELLGAVIMEALSVDEEDNLADEPMELVIEVPFDEKEEFDEVCEKFDNIEIVEVDEENGIAKVKGCEEALRAFLDELGYDDPVEDLVSEDEANEAFHHMTSVEKNLARKYRMSAAGKKALKKYMKKSSRAGYKVDKNRSKLMRKVASFRKEAIEESLANQFAATPLFESLNEAESTELKSIVHNTVSEILNQSYEKIADDVTESYETYMTEEVMPEMCRIFSEEYTSEIVKNLNENVESYIDYVVSEIVEDLDGKNFIVKSHKTEALESFSEDLLALIKDKLNIIPEQEDVLLKNKELIENLTNEIEEVKVENFKLKEQLEENERNIFVMENLPSELSEMQKENIMNYVSDVLSEAEDIAEFKSAFISAVNECLAMNEKESIVETVKEEPKNTKTSSLFNSIMNMNK